MFPVKCKDLLPIEHLVIKSVAVRGELGPLTVWVSNREEPGASEEAAQKRIRLDPRYWTKLYERNHKQSRYQYQELVLDTPIKLEPGETRVIYVHSTLDGDTAIVYDNSYYGASSKRFEDDKLSIMSGRAHVSPQVFGQQPIWGWGNAWRDRREFVGRLNYGTVYKLWNPQVQPKFGGNFQDGARAMFLCQRRWESPMSSLPDECIFYILNMCRWDWFNDDTDCMRVRRKREKAKIKKMKAVAAQRALEEARQVEANAEQEHTAVACSRRAKTDRIYADEDDVVMTDDNAEDDEEEDEDNADSEDDDFVEDDEDVDSDDDDWSDGDPYHRENVNAFSFRDIDSDDDEDEDGDQESGTQESGTQSNPHRAWMRRQFARVNILRALAAMEDGEVHLQLED